MRFAIFSHVEHTIHNQKYFGYGPYIKEMNIWLKHVDQVEVVAPLENRDLQPIDKCYEHNKIHFSSIPAFNIVSFLSVLKALLSFPILFWRIFKAMCKADHIHLRCPGNVGLLACIVQVLFPWKKKTAKYAGNWDTNSKQPVSYKLQKWILSNTFLTRNMQVLVYGEWPNQTKNIKPFFTATYSQEEIESSQGSIRNLESTNPIKFLFVGTLSPGKQPLYAIKLIEELVKKNSNVEFHIYGDGVLKKNLQDYLVKNQLEKIVFLQGNQSSERIKKAYQTANFLVLPSKSEGWPKVVAEAMFWGCIPVVTPVSCVPYMLNHGERGIVITKNIQDDTKQILELICDKERYDQMASKAMQWSRKYTLEYFETEIKKLT